MNTANDAKQLLLSMGAELVGSRYMGFDRRDSDWDYLLLSNEMTIEQLKDFGFEITTDEEYDQYKTDIVIFCRFVDTVTSVKIEAQLAHNSALYVIMKSAYDTLKQYTFLRYMPKRLRKLLFLYELYKLVKEQYHTIAIGDPEKEFILAGLEDKIAFNCEISGLTIDENNDNNNIGL